MMIGIITTDPAGTQHDTLTPYQSPRVHQGLQAIRSDSSVSHHKR